jgi:hypothetical protein
MTPATSATAFREFGDSIDDAIKALAAISAIQGLAIPLRAQAFLTAADSLLHDADSVVFDDCEKYAGRQSGPAWVWPERRLHFVLGKAVAALSAAADLAGDGAGPPALRDDIEEAGWAVAAALLRWQETDFASYQAAAD